MADQRGAWLRHGHLVWLRFRMLGVDNAFQSAMDWCLDESQSWLGDGRSVSHKQLLKEATVAGLRLGGKNPPDPVAARTSFANTAQIRRALDTSPQVRMSVLLVALDGFSIDEVASLTGMTATAVKYAFGDVEQELKELADNVPIGSQVDGHPNSIRLHGFMLESLDGLQTEQVEQHLASCAMCFERFQSLTEMREQFDAQPAPPAPPSRIRVLLPRLMVIGCLGTLALGCSGTALTFLVANQRAAVEEARWLGRPGRVELRMGDEVVPPGSPVARGTIVQIFVDPGKASYAGFALGHDGELTRIVGTNAVTPRGGMQPAPVELIVNDQGDPTVWVVVSDAPLREADVEAAVTAGEGAVTRVDLTLK